MTSVFDRMDWFADLDGDVRQRLARLKPVAVARHSVMFSPGSTPEGFVLVLGGRVGVYLTGRSGRELLLYAVEPGETCVQTTLGLLGGVPYTAEAIAETDVTAVMLPSTDFRDLMARSEPFRRFVFRAFGDRLADVMHVLEMVAFVKVEQRLAQALIQQADAAGVIETTHQELATAIGSVREVVSRRLEALASKGIVSLDRGAIHVLDRRALAAMVHEI